MIALFACIKRLKQHARHQKNIISSGQCLCSIGSVGDKLTGVPLKLCFRCWARVGSVRWGKASAQETDPQDAIQMSPFKYHCGELLDTAGKSSKNECLGKEKKIDGKSTYQNNLEVHRGN